MIVDLGLQIRKTTEFFKQVLLDPTSCIIKESGTESDLHYGFLDNKKDSIMYPRDYSYDILTKNVSAFCHYSKSLLENKLKSFILIALAGEISEQPNIEAVWQLLDVTFMKIYNEQEEGEKEKSQNVQFEEKCSNRIL